MTYQQAVTIVVWITYVNNLAKPSIENISLLVVYQLSQARSIILMNNVNKRKLMQRINVAGNPYGNPYRSYMYNTYIIVVEKTVIN